VRAAIEAMLPRFTGEIMQVPPAFSAIKIDGNRAYDLAREGEEVILDARPIQVHSLELTDIPDENTAVFSAECGKGTYVRAIARDLALALGTRGHVVQLRRLLVGAFEESFLVPLDDLRATHDEGGVEACDTHLLPVDTALSALAEVRLSETDAVRLRNGQSVILRGREAPAHGETVFATCGGTLIAIGDVDRGAFLPSRVFVGG
jgi:tRNA pseudouridine55 synthase